jgi:hypothetical protein
MADFIRLTNPGITLELLNLNEVSYAKISIAGAIEITSRQGLTFYLTGEAAEIARGVLEANTFPPLSPPGKPA